MKLSKRLEATQYCLLCQIKIEKIIIITIICKLIAFTWNYLGSSKSKYGQKMKKI